MNKAKEIGYLEEARQASSMFPQGVFCQDETPDFLFRADTGLLGIEMVELCREEARQLGERPRYVVGNAQQAYLNRAGSKPVDVSPAFTQQAQNLSVKELSESLADFVFAHQDAHEGFDEHLPEGYCYIGVFNPLDTEGQGRWLHFKAGETVRATRDLIEKRIRAKNKLIAAYRGKASEVWLLIVNDLFLGPGEVDVDAEELASWTFDFAFDKVLVFRRNPGGSGVLIELRHSERRPQDRPVSSRPLAGRHR